MIGASEFVAEENYLVRCVKFIDETIKADNKWITDNTSKPIDELAERDIKFLKTKSEKIQNYQFARPKPYFGRADYKADSSSDSIQTYYIGDIYIGKPDQTHYVHSRHSPVARLFFMPGKGIYSTPDGVISGQVILKRIFKIQNVKLADATDEIRLLPSGQLGTVAPEESVLTKALSEPKSPILQTIESTIQPAQYERIIEAPQKVLIIQGVAGSGKSQVGIERIAYLTSPFNELNLNILPEQVIIFGPTRMFLGYISNIFREYRVAQVKQTTIVDWLSSSLSHRVRLERSDSLLEKQLNAGKKRLGEFEDDNKTAKLKKSLKMKDLLERHIFLQRQDIIKKVSLLNIKDVNIDNKKRIRLRKLLRRPSGQPLNKERESILIIITNEILQGQQRKRNNSIRQLREQIQNQFEKIWPKFDFQKIYISLLTDTLSLSAASKKSLTEKEMMLLSASLSLRSKVFKLEDLPALSYLDSLLNERKSELYRHMVVDEAHDISPLEFHILYQHSAIKSFSILGDLSQELIPERGISGWREIRPIFKNTEILQKEILDSYRATAEITKYANGILRRTQPKMHKAIPYDRHGLIPTPIRSKSHSEMVIKIAETLKNLESKNYQTIGVLCKTAREAKKIQKELSNKGIQCTLIMDKLNTKFEKVVVVPINLTKGLEYDAVILPNASNNNYFTSSLHSRLLYVAITRAAHELHIHYIGTLAAVLVNPKLHPKKNPKTQK